MKYSVATHSRTHHRVIFVKLSIQIYELYIYQFSGITHSPFCGEQYSVIVIMNKQKKINPFQSSFCFVVVFINIKCLSMSIAKLLFPRLVLKSGKMLYISKIFM